MKAAQDALGNLRVNEVLFGVRFDESRFDRRFDGLFLFLDVDVEAQRLQLFLDSSPRSANV